MRKQSICIIGMGRISANHLSAIMNNSSHLDLIAVCDLVIDNIHESLKRANYSNQVAMYSNYKEMIYTLKPDIVAIATDSGSHAEIALFCLANNCHVIIEKPMALNLNDAQKIIEVSEKKNLIVSVCHQNRFNKSIQFIKKALDDGRFGKLSHIAAHVRWRRDQDYYKQADWRGKWSSDGGCLLNQCIHNADLLSWMIGDIDEVFAYTNNSQHPYIEVEDLGLAIIKGKSGTYGIFEGTVNVFPKNLEETLYIFGEKGTAKAAGTSVNNIQVWEFADSIDNIDNVLDTCNEVPPNIYGFGHSRLYEDVINALITGGRPLVDAYAGKRALELILAMYKSKTTGSPVKLPLTEFSTTDMEGTFSWNIST
jgi:UDP-N-acetyl-2-amino-2-deoxyglucuronate dehydrogenase